jgi:hypothetical protein
MDIKADTFSLQNESTKLISVYLTQCSKKVKTSQKYMNHGNIKTW